ncbi:Translin [Marasmius fiardii PR-910]|nr:Translin [Marasmius fiardii PR-910]
MMILTRIPMTTSIANDIRPAFESFRQELDEHHDRRERLIKVQFILRVARHSLVKAHLDPRRLVETSPTFLNESNTSDPSEYLSVCKSAASKGREKLFQVQQIYTGLKEDLIDEERFWRYHRQVSPGLQEYIEALSFAWFLENGTLMSSEEVRKILVGEDGVPFFPLTTSDYLLGVSDLTGELMRYAISGFGRLGGRSRASEICSFVRNCKADFERFTPYIRELDKKQDVTSQSLMKMEDAAYAVAIRASEYDMSPDQLDHFVNDFLATYSSDSDYTDRDRDRERY